MQVCWLVPAPVGVKRRSHGGRRTGQTPAVEELDHPQEAEGKSIYQLHTGFIPREHCSWLQFLQIQNKEHL